MGTADLTNQGCFRTEGAICQGGYVWGIHCYRDLYGSETDMVLVYKLQNLYVSNCKL